ncbi:MAG: hypothetical protein NZT92_05460 [Abditibacteriales bacterium]|nr:hypothetical protein [Abditibacteriales bacterium]
MRSSAALGAFRDGRRPWGSQTGDRCPASARLANAAVALRRDGRRVSPRSRLGGARRGRRLST